MLARSHTALACTDQAVDCFDSIVIWSAVATGATIIAATATILFTLLLLLLPQLLLLLPVQLLLRLLLFSSLC